MNKDFKNYKNVEKEGNIDMKLNIKVDKRELEETLDLLKQIKEEVKEINELEEKSTEKNHAELKKYIETNWEEFERWWNSVLISK